MVGLGGGRSDTRIMLVVVLKVNLAFIFYFGIHLLPSSSIA